MRSARTKTPRKTPAKLLSLNKDPIVVYCRIRPVDESEQICIKVKPNDNRTIILYPPDDYLSLKTAKECSFSYVFDENTSQKQIFDHVALPLVQDLLQGNNGLLFTYGITSSGKTYTMTGTPDDGGLLPRSLDVIFNSITEYQADKFIFKPDKFNGFEIQSPVEALMERQRESSVISRTPKPKRRDNASEWSKRVTDSRIIEDISSDMRYSVFVSYVEIYNNYIYDLLEDLPIDNLKGKNQNSKVLRKDSASNMYVFTAVECEVKTVDEALELFNRGQLRRNVANTALNSESSRSHSIFTIRIVQAPLDAMGEQVLQDKNQTVISQLSLVDLAGSERASRTRITAQKQKREAGGINSSLMVLRTCIEMLRESQNQNNMFKIPYRDSKLTLLFKTFFEGKGKIRMVVCVNPRSDDYDENIHVMRFAEVTQEVMISRPTPVSTPTSIGGLKSGRGNLYREALQRAKEHGIPVAEVLAPVVYCLPEFPVNFLDDEESIDSLIEFLINHEARKRTLIQDMERRQADFRMHLIEVDKENINLRNDKAILEKDLQARSDQLMLLEKKFVVSEDRINSGEEKITILERRLFETQHLLEEKEDLISQQNREMQAIRAKMHERLASEKDKMRRMMERRLAEKQAELEGKLCFNGEKFRMLREILNAGDWEFLMDVNVPAVPTTVPSTVTSEMTVPQTRPKRGSSESSTTEPKMLTSRSAIDFVGGVKKQRTHSEAQSKNDFDSLFAKENKAPSSSQRSVAIANLRHRRSHSSSGDVWVEHKPIGNLELNTVLQPTMKKRKSVSKLKIKDVTNKDASKYVLEHQEQDSMGEFETQLYKGDIIPSAGGGAQVVFNDVEKLRQESPPSATYNLRKRSSDGLPLREIEDRCTVAVECHGHPSKLMKKK